MEPFKRGLKQVLKTSSTPKYKPPEQEELNPTAPPKYDPKVDIFASSIWDYETEELLKGHGRPGEEQKTFSLIEHNKKMLKDDQGPSEENFSKGKSNSNPFLGHSSKVNFSEENAPSNPFSGHDMRQVEDATFHYKEDNQGGHTCKQPEEVTKLMFEEDDSTQNHIEDEKNKFIEKLCSTLTDKFGVGTTGTNIINVNKRKSMLPKIVRPFTPKATKMWIALLENAFDLHSIDRDAEKFEIAVGNIKEMDLLRLKPYILTGSWLKLKEGVLLLYTETTKAEKITEAHAIQMLDGPKALLTDIMDALEISITNLTDTNKEFIKHLYLSKLPRKLSSKLLLLPESTSLYDYARKAQQIYNEGLKNEGKNEGLTHKIGNVTLTEQMQNLTELMANTIVAVKDLSSEQNKIKTSLKKSKFTEDPKRGAGANLVGFTGQPANNEQNNQPEHSNNGYNQDSTINRNNNYERNYYGQPRFQGGNTQTGRFRNSQNNQYYPTWNRGNTPPQAPRYRNNFPTQRFSRNGPPQNRGAFRGANSNQNVRRKIPEQRICDLHQKYGDWTWPQACNGDHHFCNYNRTFLG